MPDAGPDRATYTHGHHESVLRSHRWRTAANSAGYLLEALRPGMSLLDVGCGPGTITLDLAGRLGDGRVVGIDPAPAAIEQARAAAAAVGRPLDLRVATVADLPAGLTFDVVHAHQVLQHVADPVALLAAMAARCRPGGLLAARDSDYAAMAWYPRLPELDRWLELYQRAARANRGEPDAGRHYRAWARAAGLTQARLTASTWCLAGEQDTAWWGGMWADRIVGSALADQLLDSGLSDRQELAELAQAWRRWAGDPDAVFTITHVELLAVLP